MKIKVIGKAHLQGASERTGNPYDFIQVHYMGHAPGFVGEAALTLNLDTLTIKSAYPASTSWISTGAVSWWTSLRPASEPMKKGLSHLETEYPCSDYGPGRCHTCRTRYWCMLYRTNPPPVNKEEPRRVRAWRGAGASITPRNFCNM